MKRHIRLQVLVLIAAAAASVGFPGAAANAGGASSADEKGRPVRFDALTHAEAELGRPTGQGRTIRAGSPARDARDVAEQGPHAGKVFDADDRYAINDPTAYPFAAVCKVIAHFPYGDVLEGSAVLVGDRFALTAGHVVYDAALGGFASRVDVIPAYDYGDRPFGTFRAVDTTSFRGWTDYQDYDWDFALLTLDGTPGVETGWLGLTSESDTNLSGATLNTAGYPSDRANGAAMYGATGYAEVVEPGQIAFRGTLDAFGGQSGSGVWVRYAAGRYVVGVVSTETNTFNRAARITPAVFDALDGWMDAASLADVSVDGLSRPLPEEFDAPFAATLRVDVRNDGGTAATTDVSVFARDVFGQETYLGRRSVFVAANAVATTNVAIGVPATLAGSTYDLVVEVNRDRAVAESNRDNNRTYGDRFIVLPPYGELLAGDTLTRVMAPGDVVRVRLSVAELRRVLKLQVFGAADTTAVIRRPDGTRVTLTPGAASRLRERSPLAGEWSIEIRRLATSRRSRTIRLRSLLT